MSATIEAASGPLVLGINRSADASICLMQGARVLWAIQKERLTRHLHERGRPGDIREQYGPRLPWPARPLDVVVESFADEEASGGALAGANPSADAAAAPTLAAYDAELAAALRLAPDCRHARISHHLAHVHSVFHPSPFRDAAVMVIDAHGSPVAALTDHWSGAAYVPGHWSEAASFYRADRSRVHCIGKQLWNRDPDHPVGLGMFYDLLTQAIFPGAGHEEKVMGLAPHGDAHALGLPPLTVAAGQVEIPPAWQAVLLERERFRYGADGVAFADCANLAAAGQHAFDDAILALARWLHAETGLGNLCFAGGAALNCAANGKLLRASPFEHVFIPPAPGGAGTALGCALYGVTELAGASDAYRWTHDDLGPVPQRRDIETALADRDDLRIDYLPDIAALCGRMVDLLCDGRVLALYEGGSEFGARALGHRSILADPRRAAMRDWINAQVKQREKFCPLASAVLAERAAAWFDVPTPSLLPSPSASPFMQFAVPVRPGMAARIPAVTHIDGSARLQTVGPDHDPLLRRLLTGFDARAGVPVLLTTAFHGKDEPIVETPQEAVAAFRRLPLHALAIPPFLVTKRVEPALPA